MLFFFVTDLIVDIIKNIVDDSMKVKMITHCDYFLCNKNDHWFKNCKLKHSKKQKQFDKRNKIQKKRRNNKTKNRKNKKNKNKNKNKKIKNKSKKIKIEKFYEAIKIYVNHFVFAVFVVVHWHALIVNFNAININIQIFFDFQFLNANAFIHSQALIDTTNVNAFDFFKS